MTMLRSGNTASGSILHGNKLTLDFRHKPTRAEVGLESGKNSRAYERNGPQLEATVVLPTGTLEIACFGISIATDQGGGATDTVTTHSPKFFDLLRLFPDGASARQSLSADAEALGLDQAEVDLVFPQLATGAVVPQQRVLHGLVDNWLSIDVDVSDADNGAVQADYAISIDLYHNDALDKVVRNGVFGIDLTHRPSRADLGMLDTYRLAQLSPAWNQTLGVKLLLPGGAIERDISTISSTSAINVGDDPAGTGPPKNTNINFLASKTDDVRQILLADAPILGLDTAQVAAIFGATPGSRVQQTLTGRTTSVYAVTAKVDVSLGVSGSYAANLTYSFTYR
jgi:hypothetical protein